MENLAIGFLRNLPYRSRDMNSKHVANRSHVELMKVKAIDFIVTRFPQFKDSLALFREPLRFHEAHPPLEVQDVGEDDLTAVLSEQGCMPCLPVFAKPSETAAWKLCCEVLLLRTALMVLLSNRGCAPEPATEPDSVPAKPRGCAPKPATPRVKGQNLRMIYLYLHLSTSTSLHHSLQLCVSTPLV